jgi:hypothetical protein
MPSRYKDWLRQAQRDISHAQNALEDGDYDWACFAAQQAAEKAVKALFRTPAPIDSTGSGAPPSTNAAKFFIDEPPDGCATISINRLTDE